jgi:hypothetical protein
MIRLSSLSWRAFSTTGSRPRARSSAASVSDCRTLSVPTSTARPAPHRSAGARGDGLPEVRAVGEQAGRLDSDLARRARRHPHRGQAVDGAQLPGGPGQRAADARQPQVAHEEALERDLGERGAAARERHVLLDLHQLVQPAAPGAAGRGAAGVLVDQVDLATAHHVLAVALQQVGRADRQFQRAGAVLRVAEQRVRVGRPGLQLRRSDLGEPRLAQLQHEVAPLAAAAGRG